MQQPPKTGRYEKLNALGTPIGKTTAVQYKEVAGEPLNRRRGGYRQR